MLAQQTQEAAFTSVQPPIAADRISKGGRTLTVIMFVIVLGALVLMFYWLGARRVNNFWVSRGDGQYQAQQYDEAGRSYTWAIRFDRRDAHSYLNRGYSLQNLAKDTLALPDFTRYVEL